MQAGDTCRQQAIHVGRQAIGRQTSKTFIRQSHTHSKRQTDRRKSGNRQAAGTQNLNSKQAGSRQTNRSHAGRSKDIFSYEPMKTMDGQKILFIWALTSFFRGVPFRSIPFRTSELALPRHTEFHERSTFFRGITRAFWVYSAECFRNWISMATLVPNEASKSFSNKNLEVLLGYPSNRVLLKQLTIIETPQG
jgi:hypothetical protein